MKRFLFTASLVLGLASCHQQIDFAQVKPGMTQAQTLAVTGEPGTRQPFFFHTELWMYPKQNAMVVMRGDTVMRVSLDAKKDLAESSKGLEDANQAMQGMDSLMRAAR